MRLLSYSVRWAPPDTDLASALKEGFTIHLDQKMGRTEEETAKRINTERVTPCPIPRNRCFEVLQTSSDVFFYLPLPFIVIWKTAGSCVQKLLIKENLTQGYVASKPHGNKI